MVRSFPTHLCLTEILLLVLKRQIPSAYTALLLSSSVKNDPEEDEGVADPATITPLPSATFDLCEDRPGGRRGRR